MVFFYDSSSFFDGRCPSLTDIALSGLAALYVGSERAISVATG